MMNKGKKVKDHLGNEYMSVMDMCIHYHISASTFYNRRNRGWDLEKALTTPMKPKRKGRFG